MVNSVDKQVDTPVNLGEINITPHVLEAIAVKAASEVEGVYHSRSGFQKEVGDLLGIDASRLGAKMKRNGNQLLVDVAVHLEYGYSVPKVAIAVQEKVKEQILFMTDIEINQVNVHVVSVDNDPTKVQEILHLEDEDGELFEQ